MLESHVIISMHHGSISVHATIKEKPATKWRVHFHLFVLLKAAWLLTKLKQHPWIVSLLEIRNDEW